MRKPSITYLAGGNSLFFIALLQAAPNTNYSSAILTIPYVPTRQDVVSDSLWLANVGKDDVIYDLGSGDGRIVIAAVRDRGARKAIGIEIDPKRVAESREKARESGVSKRAGFIQGDLFTNDFSRASVVFLYLGHEANLDLRSKLVRTLKPGARIVSHQFGMGEWPPDKKLDVRTPSLGMVGMRLNPFAWNPNVPDFGANLDSFMKATVSMWVVPAPLAGVWRGKVPRPEGGLDLKLILHQSLAGVTGSFQLNGSTNFEGSLRTDVWGDHLRFEGTATGKHYFEFRMVFDGHVSENTLAGTLAVFEQERLRESPWEGRRDKAEFTGAWEWPCPSGPRPVQLQIERRDRRLAATYVDGQRKMPVSDFYDFGGGFYFTLLIGREGGKIQGSYIFTWDENSGWLIGQGLASEGGITGKIAFYPYSGGAGMADTQEGEPLSGFSRRVSSAWRDWSPKKMQPP